MSYNTLNISKRQMIVLVENLEVSNTQPATNYWNDKHKQFDMDKKEDARDYLHTSRQPLYRILS